MKTNIQVLKRHFIAYLHGTSYVLSESELVRFMAIYCTRCKDGEVMAFVRIGDLNSWTGRRKKSLWPAVLLDCNNYESGHYVHGLRSFYGYSSLTTAILCTFYMRKDGPIVTIKLFDKKGEK